MTLSLSTMWAQQPLASAVRQIRRSTPKTLQLSLVRPPVGRAQLEHLTALPVRSDTVGRPLFTTDRRVVRTRTPGEKV